MKKIKNIIKNYRNTPSKIYFFLENRSLTITIVGIAAFLLRFILAIKHNDFLDALGSGIEFASLASASTIAILLYFKDTVNMQIVKKISQHKHVALFGLGAFGSALLEDEVQKENSSSYIIFENSINKDKVEYFRSSGVGIVKGDAFDTQHLDILNFETMEYAVIALGNDRLNIELATTLIDNYKDITTPIKLAVHIINQDLNTLFHQNIISNKADLVDIQTFSFYEEVAESFFEQNFIDGRSRDIMESKNDYHVVVVGHGELALNIIYQAVKIAHLPNENKLTIHIVDKEAESFKKRVIKRYTGILEVVSLEAVSLDDETIEYFKQKELWYKTDLTHVIVCYDEEERNIKIATDLFNKTYLASAVDGTLTTQINCAIFNAYKMSSKIDNDKDSFKQFFTFGDVKTICTKENLIDEKHDLLAKLVHNTYADEYEPSALYDLTDKKVSDSIHNKWYNSLKLNKKLSSKAQSKHMCMKLKALGLTKVRSDQAPKELLQLNKEIFEESLKADRDALNLSDEFLKEYSKELPKLWEKDLEPIDIKYFPKTYSTMLEKLTRAEHNRWNAFHYLNGWRYNEVKSDQKKEHDCLMPLYEFKKPELQLTVLYDIYSILYIPNYLANAGYAIEVYGDG